MQIYVHWYMLNIVIDSLVLVYFYKCYSCIMYWNLVNVNFVTWIFIFYHEMCVQHSCACSRELKVITETCMLLFYYRILSDKCLIAIKCICLFLQNDVQCYNPTILLDVVWVILHISSLVLFSEILFPSAAFSSGHLFSENLFAPWQLSAPGTFSRILSSTFVGTIFSDVVLPSIGHLFFFYSSLTLLSIRNFLIFFGQARAF